MSIPLSITKTKLYQLYNHWFLPFPESILCSILGVFKNKFLLRYLLHFDCIHQRHLPVHKSNFRNALCQINSWNVGEEYQEKLFSSVEDYLFSYVTNSDIKLWHSWLRACQQIKRNIDISDPRISRAIVKAKRANNFKELAEESKIYLIQCYQKNLDLKKILEKGLEIEQIEQEKYRMEVLLQLLPYIIEFADKYHLFDDFQNHQGKDENFQEIRQFQPIFINDQNEWDYLLEACQRLNYFFDIKKEQISYAVLQAKNAGNLKNLKKENRDYLIRRYQKVYGEFLEHIKPEDDLQMLSLIVEYVSMVDIVKPLGPSARAIVLEWANNKELRPRDLSDVRTMTDDKAYKAPIIGIGSPHKLSVTRYQNSLGYLVGLSTAGTTADTPLNTKIFTNLWATALACDIGSTLITVNGCCLFLESPSLGNNNFRETLLDAVIGPAGIVEPTPGTPSLGLDPDEAMMMVADSFHEFEEATGLVQQTHWNIEDPRNLEQKITEALKEQNKTPKIIRSQVNPSQKGRVVYTMPLLHRNSQGEVVPIEIPISYNYLNAEKEKVFNLLHRARSESMNLLIAAGERRKRMAEQMYAEQARWVKEWQSHSEAEKQRICQQQPVVEITQRVDLQLGIIQKLYPPEVVPRSHYEDYMRPQFRDYAKQSAEQFQELCQKLRELNLPGNKADLLTMKLLVDSAIRQAQLPITDADFKNEYQEWMPEVSLKLWTKIETWAIERGLSLDTLAADNILFNSRLDAQKNTLIILPCVAIDLHDFIIRIDRNQGLMQVFPGGTIPTLLGSLIPDQKNNSSDLYRLHDCFSSWVSKNLNTNKEDQNKDLTNEIIGDSKVWIAIRLKKAQQLLLKGNFAKAINVFEEIDTREKDQGSIYFWSAVAYQYRYLKNEKIPFAGVSTLSEEQKNYYILYRAIQRLIYELRREEKNSYIYMGFPLNQDLESVSKLPISQNVQTPLGQLKQWDRLQPGISYVQQLININENIPLPQLWEELTQLDERALELSEHDKQRIQAGIFALLSIERLDLAEVMKNKAKAFSFMGEQTDVARQELWEIFQQARSSDFEESSVTSQIEDLYDQLKK